MSSYRALSQEEIQTLESAGCTAGDWKKVTVADGFDPRRVKEVEFLGEIKIGSLKGEVDAGDGLRLPSELREATIANCTIGNNVRIVGVHGVLANYRIEDEAVLMDIGTMRTRPDATFGNGIELETVNEGGGREVRLFAEISSQFAYLMAMHRYRPEMISRLNAMVDKYVEEHRSSMGIVGRRAVIRQVGEITDVCVGPFAEIANASRLTNGTVLSEEAAPAFVGAGVVADGFVIAEGARVDGGTILGKCFMGQAVKAGRQFSAENSLFFANSECFHSEACSVFGGPYTVTHHRSTLLIAGMYSFYNAGSGTNQSNHMYKLGPVHQGILERGSKTGSFSYMMWPCVVSPFSVVIGKNMANFDIAEFPFSYVTAEEGGSFLTPGMNMFTVGTTRDGEKWPSRDRRKATRKRDQIRFEVFSPFVAGRMIRGESTLSELSAKTDRKTEIVRHKGVAIKRLLLRAGAKNYTQGIEMYLSGKIAERAAANMEKGLDAVRKSFAVDPDAIYSEEWCDIGGLLIARERLVAIEDAIASGKIDSIEAFNRAFEEACAAYEKDEWAWVRKAWGDRHGKSLESLSYEDIESIRFSATKARASFATKILADAQKEFDETSRLGFGVDAGQAERDAEFEAIRGTYAGNSFVKKMQAVADQGSPAKV